MSNQRIVNFSLIATVALMVYVFAGLLDPIWVYFELPDRTLVRGVNYPTLIGAVIAVGTGGYLRQSSTVNTFLVEAVDEIRQIVWPSREEVIGSTKIVIFTSLFLALVLGAFDLIWAKISKFILS